MELHGEEVVPPDHRGELHVVFGGAGDEGFIIGEDVIGMDEVEVGVIWNAF